MDLDKLLNREFLGVNRDLAEKVTQDCEHPPIGVDRGPRHDGAFDFAVPNGISLALVAQG